MTDREKLIELIGQVQYLGGLELALADHLLANGVHLEESKRIEELKAQLAEREKVVIQLRKQWQDAEMHICTMCGHFDHKTDGNIVYGNKTCGEICGYPFCAAKFSPWIPVSERLPDKQHDWVLVACKLHPEGFYGVPHIGELRNGVWWDDCYEVPLKDAGVEVTHWMPLPEPPKEEMNNG